MERHFSWKSPKIILVFTISLLSLFGLLLGGKLVNAQVFFADPGLEAAIREKINKPTQPIRKADVITIISLDAAGRNIHQLEGIQALKRLANLNLAHNAIEDLRPLAKLKMLSELDLSFNLVSNLEKSHLDQLSNSSIRVLNLRQNNIQNITLLKKFTQLEKLNLRENLISDLTPLSNLSSLTYLNIHSNPVEKGLDSLGNLTELETLIMRNVFIGDDYMFLENMTKLNRLNIRNSGITNVAILGKLMEAGALQDNPAASLFATIDLLQIDPDGVGGDDPYLHLRRYWDNISSRYPLSLPYYYSLVHPPQFSHESGFYEEAFTLTITTDEPGARIFYTTDGSEPALTPQLEPMAGTFKYSEPMLIEKQFFNNHSIANIKTSSEKDYPNKNLSNLFIGNIIRAVVITTSGERSNVITQSYFIDDNIFDEYTFPVVSIAVNPEHFFDDEIGIYVPGDLFEDIFPDSPWWNPANYTQRGLKWERPIVFQMFSPSGNLMIDQNMGVRIHGGATRAHAQKSLRLLPGHDYDEQTVIQYNFFPTLNNRFNDLTVDTFNSLILRNSGNDWAYSNRWHSTMFRDAFSQSLLETTNLDIQGFQPIILFLNGEYWGIHNVRTRYDEHYFETYYGIDPNDLTVLESGVGKLRFGAMGTETEYRNLLKLLDEEYYSNKYQTSTALSNQILYEHFASKIDIENFIYYNISNIYFDNSDWGGSDILFWRINKIPEGNLDLERYGHDGKWRWVIKDIDFGFFYPMNNTISFATRDASSSTYLFRSLLENDDFKNLFINFSADYLNTIFREEIILSNINRFEELYSPQALDQINRWGNMGGSYEGWLENVQMLRDFATLRPDYLRQHIVDHFNLPGIEKLSLHTQPQRGYLRINSIELIEKNVGTENPGNWEGIYFRGVPIELEAIPNAGYRFVRWEGLDPNKIDINSNLIQFELIDALAITAIFEKD